MQKIQLIRHGQARAGTHDYDRLSIRGEQQAAIVGRHLLANNLSPWSIWSGSLKRQRQTACIAHTIDSTAESLRIHDGLNEYDHALIHSRYHPDPLISSNAGRLDDPTEAKHDLPSGMTFPVYAEILKNWADDRSTGSDPAIESWIQFKSRTLAAVVDATEQSDSQSIAIYSSGGVIATIAGQLTHRADRKIPELIWKMSNASITTLAYHNGRLNLLALNEISHFEAHPDQSLITWI